MCVPIKVKNYRNPISKSCETQIETNNIQQITLTVIMSDGNMCNGRSKSN